MKQAIGESLSALMDQQADELDLQRVLNALDDEQLRQRWQRYHLASAAMRNELDEFASVDLTVAISEALPQDAAGNKASLLRQRFSGALKPVASVAVAASVSAVILGGAQLYNGMLSKPAAVPPALASNGDVSAALAVSRRVGFNGPMLQASSATGQLLPGEPAAPLQASTLEYDRADALARQKLQAHLQSHLENASLNTSSGMMPFARAASAQGEQ